MGWRLSHHQPDVAPELGAPDTVFCLPGRHSQGDLHDQRHRVSEHVAAQSDQDQGIVPQSGSGAEVTLSGTGARCYEVDHAGAELESRLAAFRHSAGRPRSARRVGMNWKGEEETENAFPTRIPEPSDELRSNSRIPAELRKNSSHQIKR